MQPVGGGVIMSNEGTVAIITPEESWYCHTLPESQVDELEHGTSLGILYRLWRSVRGGGVPNKDAFSPGTVVTDANSEGLLRISTEASNPMEYTFVASRPEESVAKIRSIGSLATSIPQRELIIDLLYCQHLRAPIFQDINHAISMAEYHYRRLLLPVQNGSGIVSGIFLCYRMLESEENHPSEMAFL